MIAGDNIFTKVGAATVGSIIAENAFKFVGRVGDSLLGGSAAVGHTGLDYAVSSTITDIKNDTSFTTLSTQTATVLMAANDNETMQIRAA